jgi:hypothetical protein
MFLWVVEGSPPQPVALHGIALQPVYGEFESSRTRHPWRGHATDPYLRRPIQSRSRKCVVRYVDSVGHEHLAEVSRSSFFLPRRS